MNDEIKTIVLTDNYALNIGDVAILIAMVQCIQCSIPKTRIAIESSHPDELKKYAELSCCDIFPRVMDAREVISSTPSMLTRMRVYVVGIYDLVSFFFWAIFHRLGLRCDWIIRKKRQEQARQYSRADAFVSVGGALYYNKL